MNDVKVTGMTRQMPPKANSAGNFILAFFDCEANGIALRGCAFVKTERGLTVWAPRLDSTIDCRRSVWIANDSLRNTIMYRAQETYRALGGTDGEFKPRLVPGNLPLPELKQKIERCLELHEAHHDAIQNEDPESQKFYEDGRREELDSLATELRNLYGIKPWQDQIAILEGVLEEMK